MRPIVFAALMLFCFTTLAQSKKLITPTRSVAKVILKGKKDYTYHALSEQSKTEFKVTGPGKMYVNVRVRLIDGKFKSDPFRLKHIRSSKHIETAEVPTLLAGNLKFKSSKLTGTPSKHHRIEIDVPPGTHTYKFYKQRTDQKVHIRAFYTKHAKPKWADMKPNTSLVQKNVRFQKSGKELSYYQITKNDGFKFTVHDSARIRLIVRPEFSYRMLDETTCRFQLKNLTTGEVKVYKVNTRRSRTTEFVGDKQNTPGNSSTIYLNLGKPLTPSHEYEITLLNGAKSAVVRLSSDTNLTI